MKSAIRQIYEDRCTEETKITAKQYQKTIREYYSAETTFEKSLSKEQKELWDNLGNIRNYIEDEENLNNFKQGFSLGVRVVFEAFGFLREEE